MIKIFHTSDLHIGMTFKAYPDIREKLIEARYRCLERLIEISNKNRCDLFVIAGDLFDSIFIPKKNVLRVLSILNGFNGRLILILPGNHDFILPDGLQLWSSFKENSPDNILLLEKTEPYSLKEEYEIDVCIYPAPCGSKNSSENSIGWIMNTPKDENVRLHIGVAHGSLEGVSPDFYEKYYPMKKEELLRCGLDMWLIGHTHIQYPSSFKAHENIFYAGTPEPDGFDCNHEGKAWILEIGDDKVITPISVSTGQYRFLHEEFSLNNEDDIERLKVVYLSDKYRNSLLKLRLSGRLKEDLYKEMLEVLNLIKRHIFYVDLVDEVKKQITIDVINEEFTEGSFPHRLLMSLLGEPDALHLAYDLIKEIKR
jgi:DNA repair exonuclease SbcCD nuclease subunit